MGLTDIRSRLSAVEAKETPPCDHLATIGDLQATVHVLKRSIETSEEDVRSLVVAVHDLVDDVERLKLAIDEGILKTNRAERRVRTAVQRARSELAALGLQDPTVEAEASELRDLDGERGDESGVRLLPPAVGADSETPSSVKGISIEQIRRVRGL